MSAGRAVGHGSMVIEHLLEYGAAGILSPVWLKASFLLMLVGYGTKMGLAPLHTWLPDAHSESPSSVSALLSGAPNKRSIHIIETIAGDTTAGHALAYSQVLEALCSMRTPVRALGLRGIAIELERIANHAGDLEALAGDVGFLPTASHCGRIRGDVLNLTASEVEIRKEDDSLA